MNCQECQYALSPFDKTCPRCAQNQKAQQERQQRPQQNRPQQTRQRQPAAAHAVQPNAAHSAPLVVSGCAACGNPAIQKVSGLHTGGVWSAEANGLGLGYGRTSGGQSFTTVSTSHSVSAGGTGLAQALAPPKKPQSFQTKAENIVIGGTLVAFLIWLMGWFVVIESFSGIPVPVYILVASAATLVPLAAIPSALKANREQKATMIVLLGRWRRAMSHWDQLYYCSRCDRVSNPQTGQHAPSAAVSGLWRQDILEGTSRL